MVLSTNEAGFYDSIFYLIDLSCNQETPMLLLNMLELLLFLQWFAF